MFFICAVIIGVILGYLRRGRIRHLASLQLRSWGLVVIALLIQLAIFPLFSEQPLFPYATAFLHFLSYGLIFLFLFHNHHVRSFCLVGLGSFLNLLVISLNGGYMPSSLTALERSGAKEVAAHLLEKGVHGNVILMSGETSLNFFGDFLYLPWRQPFVSAFSIGDLLLALGLIGLIAQGMKHPAS